MSAITIYMLRCYVVFEFLVSSLPEPIFFAIFQVLPPRVLDPIGFIQAKAFCRMIKLLVLRGFLFAEVDANL